MTAQENTHQQAATPVPVDRQGLDILDYLLIIVRHKKLIFYVTFAAALLSVGYSLTLKNIYTAKTMVTVSEDDKGIMGALMGSVGGGAAAALGGLGGPTKADLYVTMLKTEAIKDPIIERFKLMQLFKAKFRASAYKKLAGNTKVSAGKKDSVITITVDDKDPKLAAAIANAYVEELGKMATGISMSKSARNRQFLEERLLATKVNLAKSEDDLKAYQSKNKILDVPEQARVSIKGVAQLHGRLVMQELQLLTLKGQFTDSSHEVKTAAAAVANIKNQIAQLEGSGSGGGAIPSVGNVPELGQAYVRLLREFKIQETLFELLTKQYEMARFSEAKDVSPVQVIQAAEIPENKSKPSRSKIVIMVTFLSFLLSVVFVLAKDGFARMSAEELNRWNSLWAEVMVLRKLKVKQ